MPGIQDRYAAFAVLKGPDVDPRTNLTSIAREFRKATSRSIALGTLAEKLANAATPETSVDNPTVEARRTAASSVGKVINKQA